MTAPARPDFRKGADASADASKGGGNFPKTHYFGLSDAESAIVRFLTDKDDWPVVDQHMNVPTKNQPKDWPDGANWPAKMGAVCRADKALKPVYANGCYICDNLIDGKAVKKPSGRTWALACLREEVFGDGTLEMGGQEMKGKVVGICDQVREVAILDKDGKPTGDSTKEKAVVVVNMGYKNFFSALHGFAGHYGTVLDRDYLIKRKGTDETTTYAIIPLDPIDIGQAPANPPNPQFPNRYDLRAPEFAERYKTDIDLVDLLLDRSSDEFYARFFDKRVESPPLKKKEGDTSVTVVPEKADNEPSGDRMAALASRVTDYGAAAPAAAPAAAAPAAEPAAPAAAPVPAAAGGMRDFG